MSVRWTQYPVLTADSVFSQRLIWTSPSILLKSIKYARFQLVSCTGKQNFEKFSKRSSKMSVLKYTLMEYLYSLLQEARNKITAFNIL